MSLARASLLTALLATCATSALAQTDTSDAPSIALEEVIVTAQRREQSLQDVPAAVSAFSEEQLAENGITRAEDLSRIAPSFQTSRFVGRPDAVSFGIRGQRQNDIRMTNDPSVITYLAEVPQMRPFGLGLLGFLDIRSVEIVKGPQGTLFGRNATGGAVLITPNTPSEVFEGRARVTAGNYRKLSGDLVVSGPLAEGLSGRIALTGGHRDGYIENRGPFKDLLSENYFGGRGSLAWRPTDDLSSIFYVDGLVFRGAGQSGVLRAVNPAGTANRYPLGVGGGGVAALAEQQASGFYSTRTSSLPFTHLQLSGISNTTTWTLNDNLKLKNVAGYRRILSRVNVDVDGTPFAILETQQRSNTTQYSEELQLQYSDERFDLIGGAFWFKERGDDGGVGTFFAGIAPPKVYDQHARNISYSVFAEGTWHATDRLDLTLGLRQTWDERQFSSSTKNLTACALTDENRAPLNPCRRNVEADFDKLTWNLTANYELTEDQRVYVSARRGYRTGGFNIGSEAIGQFTPYRPETVDNYEIGYKADFRLGDQALRFNAAAYYSDYANIQKSVARCIQLPGTTSCSLQTAIENAAAAVIKGLELESTWLPTDDLQITGFYAYTDASYDEWRSVGAGGVVVDLSATGFGYLPKHKGGLTARYRVPAVDMGDLYVQGSAAYTSRQQLDELAAPGVDQKSYTLVSGRVEWRDGLRKGLTVSAWVNNLTKEKYFVGSNNVYASAGFTSGYLGEPRTYGIDLNLEF